MQYLTPETIDTSDMKTYRKKIDFAFFLDPRDLAPAGSHITIQTMEGPETLPVSENFLIMIGTQQDAYPIERPVFEERYVPSDEKLGPVLLCRLGKALSRLELRNPSDNGTGTTAAEAFPTCPASDSRSILQKIRLCKLRQPYYILAKPLEADSSVTLPNGETIYSAKGNYLVCPVNDQRHFYFVHKDVFANTYE